MPESFGIMQSVCKARVRGQRAWRKARGTCENEMGRVLNRVLESASAIWELNHCEVPPQKAGDIISKIVVVVHEQDCSVPYVKDLGSCERASSSQLLVRLKTELKGSLRTFSEIIPRTPRVSAVIC